MIKRTPLYTRHLQRGAKMVEFAGWQLPIQFDSSTAEHSAVREHAGVFDIGHMGVVTVRGRRAIEFLQLVLTNDVYRLSHTGKVVYTCMCREDGGILDDLLVYENFEEGVLLVVNGATTDSDLQWLWSRAEAYGFDPTEVSIAHRTDLSMLALQGPASVELLQPLLTCDLEHLKYYNGMAVRLRGNSLACGRGPAVLSRTGYTGEDGFEIIAPADMTVFLWDRLVAAGATPAGLAARDVLRLEMGYSLYGQDISDERTPIEANLGWTVSFKKVEEFIGRNVLERQRKEGTASKLVGMKLLDKGIPRTGFSVYAGEEPIGRVTSGTLSPRLGTGIALGYVDSAVAEAKAPVEIEIRKRRVPAEIVDLPFYHPPKPAKKFKAAATAEPVATA